MLPFAAIGAANYPYPMHFTPTALPGVVILEPAVLADERGWFMESFNQSDFERGLGSLGLPAPTPFVQDNESQSRRGVLRGLHYQLPPNSQGKLVRVAQGAVFDVAVDVRRSSPHFGCWVGMELSAANRLQMWIPEGFAHGFVALVDDTHFLYKTTAFYSRESERAIAWNEARIGIAWPEGMDFVLAPKDAGAPSLAAAQTFP
jgi:dTDP-4-dehydrorhamnose 3,5-epimerase